MKLGGNVAIQNYNFVSVGTYCVLVLMTKLVLLEEHDT